MSKQTRVPDEWTDGFCGAGGSSIGIKQAGFNVKVAANHWERAIETHSANFPDTEHLCADLSQYDMRRLPRTRFAWFSPECTWHSPAGGRQRRRAQLDMFDEYVPNDAGDRSRMTMVDVIRATEAHRYDAVIVENVVEVAMWELFDWWLAGMAQLGYRHQIVCVSSAHIGDEQNMPAPQWRDRIYVVFTREALPLPDVAPRPIAWCISCGDNVRALQSWKRPERRRIGKYGQQYLYRCPNDACRHQVVEPYVLPAAAAIDWSDVGQRIGDRTRPLAPATVRRIEAGLRMFAQPVLAANAGNTYEAGNYRRVWPAFDAPLNARQATSVDGVAVPGAFLTKHYTPRGRDEQMVKDPGREPLGAITSWDHHSLVTPPFLLNVNHDDDRIYRATDGPLPTRTVKIGDGLALPEPFITMLRENADATSLADPLATLTTGRNHALTVPPGAFVSKHHGGLDYGPIDHMNKSVNDPLATVVGRSNISLVIPYRKSNRTRTTAEPLHTLSTHESAGLCTIEIDVDDCHFRMLKPREHLRGQRFPELYIVHGNQGEQTMQAGNAVSSNVAYWLVTCVREALDGGAA